MAAVADDHPYLLNSSCTRYKVQQHVYTPSRSLTLTYTPPPSAAFLHFHCFPTPPLPADLDLHVTASNMSPGMDCHVIVYNIAAPPLHDDMDRHASSIVDSPIITSDTPPHPLHVDMNTPGIPIQPLHAEMDTHISTPTYQEEPPMITHADVNTYITKPAHADVDANIVAEEMALESRLFRIWANGFDPVSLLDISSTLATPNHHCHLPQLEQLPSLVPDPPPSSTSDAYAASKYSTREIFGHMTLA